jgi:hypothetical protein
MPVSIREAQAIDAADCGRTIHAAFAAIAAQQNRTLYSLRHMYATFQIVYGGIDFPCLHARWEHQSLCLNNIKVT